MLKMLVFHANAIRSERSALVHRLAVHAFARLDLLDENVRYAHRATVDRIAQNVRVINEEQCPVVFVKPIANARYFNCSLN